MPFAAAISVLYSLLLVSAIENTEDYISKEYLQREFDRFADEYRDNTAPPALPRTSYLRSYWRDDLSLPSTYKALEQGLFESEDTSFQILVSAMPQSERQLVMVLDESSFSTIEQLTPSILSAISLIAVIVTVIAVLVAIFIARSLTRPISALARDVADTGGNKGVFFGCGRTDEIGMLSRALGGLVDRLSKALEREKLFTRHASHEMRTPLAVIVNSASVLELPEVSAQKKQRNIKRIQSSCENLNSLLEVFLCLGQEDAVLETESVTVRKVLDSTLEKYRQALSAKHFRVELDVLPSQTVAVSPPLLAILVDNMLRNAVQHGTDHITITVSAKAICVTNGIADPTSTQQFGYGLEICRRICERLQWTFNTLTDNHSFVASVEYDQGPRHL